MKEQILAVQRMQDYIGENLSCPEGITMAKLAEVSLFSPWHSYRLFKEYTGLTPAEYIRKMRLSQSAMRLKDGELKVIDCAIDKDEFVLPMLPPGGSMDDIITRIGD